ncbi:hypothetical protein [Porphyromonas macacae]|uniref:hypothetical protein n=1 Tax=Porphyromonas macacae TaxID=28115 RepID=UPI0024AE01C4|nr:hypothetical protein [Porphyromonas macacae]
MFSRFWVGTKNCIKKQFSAICLFTPCNEKGLSHFSEFLCLMVENSSGKEEKSKLTWIKIHQAKNFQPSGREFFSARQSLTHQKEAVPKMNLDTAPYCSFTVFYKRFTKKIIR